MFITWFGCARSSTSTACSSMSPQTCTICSLWSLYKQTFMYESAREVHCKTKWGFDTVCVHKLESVGMISCSQICEQNVFNISIGKKCGIWQWTDTQIRKKRQRFSQKIKSTKAQNLFEQWVIEVKKRHSKRMKHFHWCFRAFGWKLQVAPLSLSLRLLIIIKKIKNKKRRKESEP